ncbi:baseplate multidomain protein megatron [Litorimonas sp. WD9-15]|uniref:baseplate multidomain protein megatron n=1 Tax=Litorimonas sp. WD9-15 TaxID=3418716 RepID=UPI003D045E27
MANLATTAAQFAGQALVNTASQIAIATATSYISRAFDNRNFQGPRLDGFHLQTSRDGAPMARVFGRVRLAGQVIWASHVRETSTEESVGGKGGGPTQTNFSYTISFAIGLCEGEILGVDRIWANGVPLATVGLDMRVYRGTETQAPDPIIAATEPRAVPAFRGTAYLVFEDFPLDEYGSRLPQINVEVVRAGRQSGRLESLVQSVNLLPGSGEFAYATTIIEESQRPGQTRPMNMNNLSGQADIELALDQLQAQLPNCRNVSIINSWFGTSMRAADCEIRPGVEQDFRNVRNSEWQVGRDNRGSAWLVSTDGESVANGGRPNFGGTPSDESIIQAIRAIRGRGMTVTLYPFLMMDVEGFPWRGRVTSHRDGTNGVRGDINDFFGTAQGSDFTLGAGEDHHRGPDNRFRNYILTQANLARRAGGVDRFVIGSEMVALTTLRDASNRFPAVEKLAELAGDVRAMLGPNTGITYAADWSEYFGFHPQDGSGDVNFHLDELWSHPAITAVGIDAYFPLSDWREGDHVDGANFDHPYAPEYLSANIEGGEGYEWYYASDADRDAQIRTPISDWIYRYKDLRNWWKNEHRNRIGGVEQSPTDWVPESKPFWLTEIGCPAVRFGANQPNIFSDGQSIESDIPYYSDGSRDDLIQRRYLEAMMGYWENAANNPVSGVSGERMIDSSAMAVWAWDARPYPDFPARTDTWSDGQNWQTGHWINGRTGLVLLADVITDICAEAGLFDIDVSRVSGLVSGFTIDRPMRARDALSALMQAYDISLAEEGGIVHFFTPSETPIISLELNNFIDREGGLVTFSTEDNTASLKDARLTFIDASRDYQTATVSARNELAETVRIADLQAPIVFDPGQARRIVDHLLAQSEPARQMARFSLSPMAADDVSVGGRIRLPETAGVWQIVTLQRGDQLDVGAVLMSDRKADAVVTGSDTGRSENPVWVSEPVAATFEFPGTEGPQLGALMDPFRPAILSLDSISVTVEAPVRIGGTTSDLRVGPIGVWDRTGELNIWMPGAQLVARSEADVMAGRNRFAIETAKGWEIIGAADIVLTGPESYRLKTLLRGLSNSDDGQVFRVPAGARIIALDGGLATLPVEDDFLGQEVEVTIKAGGRSGVPATFTYRAAHRRPLSPVHLSVTAEGEMTRLDWIPRNRDESNEIDPNAVFRVKWETEEIDVAGISATLPILTGSGVKVSVAQLDTLTGEGPRAEIIV